MSTNGVGRPRSFDQETALRHAADLFWERGYAATSLDDLLAAMGIARSSFYAVFGSKHGVLIAALECYTAALFERMRAAAQAHADEPRHALRAVLRIAACSTRPDHGCLFVNMASELAPADAQVRELGAAYLGRVDALMTAVLLRCGLERERARAASGALLAFAAGAVLLRKAGQPQSRIEEMLGTAESLAGIA